MVGWRWMAIALLSLWLWSIALPAKALTAQDIPNPRTTGGWVSDQAEVISAPTEQRINGLLTALETNTRIEMAVVTVATTAPATTPKVFATELFNTWGIGKAAENNGVLLLVSTGDRRIEIETGSGMGDRLPNDHLTDIIQTQMKPAFQQGDLEQGIWNGVTAITTTLADMNPNAPLVNDGARSRYAWVGILGLGLAGVGYGWVLVVGQRPGRLPPTGQSPYNPSFSLVELNQISFDRLVASTAYCNRWPRAPLMLIAIGLTLMSGAIAFWVLALAYQPYTSWGDALRLITLSLGSLMSIVLLYPLDRYMRRQPLNLMETIPNVIAGVLLSSMIIAGFGLVLGLWNWVMGTAPPQTEVTWLIPVYVALWNVGITGYFARDRGRTLRTPRQYVCQTCQQPIEPVAPEALRNVLPTRAGVTRRAWRCLACHPTLTQDGLFVITHEKPISSASSQSASNTTTYYSAPSSSSSPSTSDDYTPWDTSSSSSSSDFGGGSSDGGGVGDNW